MVPWGGRWVLHIDVLRHVLSSLHMHKTQRVTGTRSPWMTQDTHSQAPCLSKHQNQATCLSGHQSTQTR